MSRRSANGYEMPSDNTRRRSSLALLLVGHERRNPDLDRLAAAVTAANWAALAFSETCGGQRDSAALDVAHVDGRITDAVVFALHPGGDDGFLSSLAPAARLSAVKPTPASVRPSNAPDLNEGTNWGASLLRHDREIPARRADVFRS